MIATNHAVTGAVIGLMTASPVIALPAALVSHYICDALPHYASKQHGLHSRFFRNMLIVDTIGCVLIVALLTVVQPPSWQLAVTAAFVATTPDLLWIPKYTHARQGRAYSPNRYDRFASRIQWYEQPAGAFVEFAWFVVGLGIIFAYGF